LLICAYIFWTHTVFRHPPIGIVTPYFGGLVPYVAPKYDPGQIKDDPDHGFRVCVNALINKCLKPYASIVPLATDEIKKLSGYKYFLQVDGFSAYWSIPVC
jgi:hypothetical protein